jgi:hypothetical protein
MSSPAKPPAKAPARPSLKRPFGVTALAILAIIAGVVELLVAFADFAQLGLFGSGAASITAGTVNLSGPQELRLILAVVVLVLACLEIIFAIGALSMRRWAWGLGVMIAILSILDAGASAVVSGRLTGGDAVTVIVAVLVLIYFYSAHIQTAFGRK